MSTADWIFGAVLLGAALGAVYYLRRSHKSVGDLVKGIPEEIATHVQTITNRQTLALSAAVNAAVQRVQPLPVAAAPSDAAVANPPASPVAQPGAGLAAPAGSDGNPTAGITTKESTAMLQPLTGVNEFMMRAHVASGAALFRNDLLAALGGQEQINAYIAEYGPGNASHYYDDKANGRAARAAQWVGMVPGQFAWGSYLQKGQAEAVDGQFWWLPPVMGEYAQFTKPRTRQGV